MELILRDPAIPDVADVHSFNQGQAHALAAMRAVCVEKAGEDRKDEDVTDGLISAGRRAGLLEIIDLIDETKEHYGN